MQISQLISRNQEQSENLPLMILQNIMVFPNDSTMEGTEAGGLAKDEVDEVDDWEMVAVVEEFAMVTAIEGAEGFNPSFEEVRKCVDWLRWEAAIQVELKNLKDNGTWTMVKWPAGANIISSNWVLHVKKNATSEVKKYRARLVAKGFTQIYSVDFYETYTPVARLASFQLLLTVTARNDWPVNTFDFDSAYLNNNKIIYLEQPPHYEMMDCCCYVWKLNKTSV